MTDLQEQLRGKQGPEQAGLPAMAMSSSQTEMGRIYEFEFGTLKLPLLTWVPPRPQLLGWLQELRIQTAKWGAKELDPTGFAHTGVKVRKRPRACGVPITALWHPWQCRRSSRATSVI